MATWFMTLVIQRAEHRDTQAIHAKLDEMLHALGKARNELTRVDEEDPEEIEERSIGPPTVRNEPAPPKWSKGWTDRAGPSADAVRLHRWLG
jgi:Low affinity iron permease